MEDHETCAKCSAEVNTDDRWTCNAPMRVETGWLCAACGTEADNSKEGA